MGVGSRLTRLPGSHIPGQTQLWIFYTGTENKLVLLGLESKWKISSPPKSLFKIIGFPGGSVDKRICLKCRRTRFDPWVGKIPWTREWQPTPAFLPGEFHGQRSLACCSPWDPEELDTTERQNWTELTIHTVVWPSTPPISRTFLPFQTEILYSLKNNFTFSPVPLAPGN